MPSACDDGPYGNGTGGELTYRVTVPARGRQDGVDRRRRLRPGPRARAEGAREGAQATRQGAGGQDGRRARRSPSSPWSTSPATACCSAASTGASRTSPTSRSRRATCRSAASNQGKDESGPVLGTVKSATFFGAGYPDYPWLFATDGEYTAFAAVAVGQFEPIEAHLRALRDVSEVLNGTTPARSPTRSSPTARSTSGTTQRTTDAERATPTSRSSSRAPSRWSGAGRATTLPRRHVRLLRRNLHYVGRQPRRRPRRLARGTRQRRARRAWARRSSTTPST